MTITDDPGVGEAVDAVRSRAALAGEDMDRPEAGDLRRRRILVVDDQEANVRLLQKVLRNGGYADVLATTEPQRALEMCVSNEPDVILLDLHMPKMDGYALLAQLRRSFPSAYLPIVILTADSQQEAKLRALSLGASEFLTKPFDAAEVLTRVENLLTTRSLYLELEREKGSLEQRVDERTRALQQSRAELEATLVELRRADGDRQRLLAALVRAQEEERARIAADIHDDSIQVMTAVGIQLGIIRGDLKGTPNEQAIREVEDIVRRTIGRLRQLLFDLRPPTLDREGLAATVKMSLRDLERLAGIRWELHDAMTHEPSPETRVVVFRIAQEALVNVRKHSQASRVEVFLGSREEGVIVRVRDDGRGFSRDDQEILLPGHIGLQAMRERAEMAKGWFRIDSALGTGTVVEFWIPQIGHR